MAWPVILVITGVLAPVVYGGIALDWMLDHLGRGPTESYASCRTRPTTRLIVAAFLPPNPVAQHGPRQSYLSRAFVSPDLITEWQLRRAQFFIMFARYRQRADRTLTAKYVSPLLLLW